MFQFSLCVGGLMFPELVYPGSWRDPAAFGPQKGNADHCLCSETQEFLLKSQKLQQGLGEA